MGNRISSTQEIAARAKSDAIDRELDQEFKSLQKECKILWLGERFDTSPLCFTTHLSFRPDR